MRKYEFHLTPEALSKISGATAEEIIEYTENEMLPLVYSKLPDVLYRPNAVQAIRFVRHTLKLGFSLEEVRMMISMIEMFGGGSDYVGAVVHDKIMATRNQLSQLLSIEKELMKFETRCVSDRNYLLEIASIPSGSNQIHA